MKLKLFDILKIIVGVGVLLYLVNKIGLENINEAFLKFNILYLLPYVTVHITSFFTAAINIKFLSDRIKVINFRKIFRYNIISWSFGQFVPAKLGEFSIIYYFRKEGMKFGEAAAIAVMDKAITTVAVAFIAVIGLTVYFKFFTPAFVVIYLVLVLFGILFFDKLALMAKKHLLKGFFSKFSEFIVVVEGYIKNQRAILIGNAALTFVKWMIMSIGSYYLFLGFGHEVGFINILLINSIGTIVALIPISLAGLGVRESVTVYLFTTLGVPAEIALSVALIQLIINYITAIGVLSLVKVK